MKKLIYIFLTLSLLSCEKEVDSNKENTQEDQKVKYFAEIQFNKSMPLTKVVKVNGVYKDSYSFFIETGDSISIEANNYCWWENSQEICDYYQVKLLLDGNTIKAESCYCNVLKLNYTVE